MYGKRNRNEKKGGGMMSPTKKDVIVQNVKVGEVVN